MAGAPSDFFEIWRSLVQQWEATANAALGQATQNEQFGREVNRYLTASVRMQGMFNDAVEKALVSMNLPSRGEIDRLGEKLDVLDRKVTLLLEAQQLGTAGLDAGPPPNSPPRTRRAPEG